MTESPDYSSRIRMAGQNPVVDYGGEAGRLDAASAIRAVTEESERTEAKRIANLPPTLFDSEPVLVPQDQITINEPHTIDDETRAVGKAAIARIREKQGW